MDMADIKIDGQVSYLEPFAERHLVAPAYLGWLHDYEVIKTLNLLDYVESPPSLEAVRRYCEGLWASRNDMLFALHDRSDDAFVGTVRVGHIDWRAKTGDIGIMIGARERWGRGLATDAIGALARYLFDDVCLRKLTAGAMANNPAMLRTFERLGFRREGVLRRHDLFEGDYVDHVYFGCFENELVTERRDVAAAAAGTGG
ncbi:MAG: GNAT family protein [Alphaproteobacteria bacterium]|nr:GNAT family protein [Alphaproteobacteria bacterium]